MNDQKNLFGQPVEETSGNNPVGRDERRPLPSQPLADRMRPRELDELIGQEAIIGPGTLLRKAAEKGVIPSMILWGPPGSGKTSLALILVRMAKAQIVTLSAVTSGVKDIREVVANAGKLAGHSDIRTILFVDEIHRFNKSQQDALLPHVESGLVTLIGATTENPSFEVISALLSRCQVYVLETLNADAISGLLERALREPKFGYGLKEIEVAEGALAALADAVHGDARAAMNALELAVEAATEDPVVLTPDLLLEALQKKALLYDKSGEEHFNLISAFHKSLRGSDPDAALYWMARMLCAGEEPLYVARRMVRFASEDVGNADPQALPLALAAMDTYRVLGSPEGELALAQAALYLATAPKSNAAYTAFKQAQNAALEHGPLPVPLAIRNAPTDLMKDLGYGKEYRYDHDSPEGYLPQQYLPDSLKGTRFYYPVSRGFEKEIQKRIEDWNKLGEEQRNNSEQDEG